MSTQKQCKNYTKPPIAAVLSGFERHVLKPVTLDAVATREWDHEVLRFHQVVVKPGLARNVLSVRAF
jgi:hypothetical protein